MLKKPNLRFGMDEFFPTKYYYDIMKKLVVRTDGQMTYKQMITGGADNSTHGIKLHRMCRIGLIEKKERGLYQITPYGRKIVKAVDAYKEAMK